MSKREHPFLDETLITKVSPVTSGLRSEPELYVEPTRMTSRDTLGVIAALIALALIGVGGYVWLNPKLDARNLLAFRSGSKPPEIKPATAASSPEHIDCPYCGMYADTSESTVAVMWQDGGSATFDSFDCLFNYIKEKNVKLNSGTIRDYEAHGGDKWIDLKQASYLYDTTVTIEGSMPPNVAAYATNEEALKHKKEMGGEVLDFAGLEQKWEKKS